MDDSRLRGQLELRAYERDWIMELGVSPQCNAILKVYRGFVGCWVYTLKNTHGCRERARGTECE